MPPSRKKIRKIKKKSKKLKKKTKSKPMKKLKKMMKNNSKNSNFMTIPDSKISNRNALNSKTESLNSKNP